MGKSSKREKGKKSDQQEKIFFHDLINHTHGLLLFLKNKLDLGHLEYEDGELMALEIEALQQNVQDYFGYEHKNLTAFNAFIPFKSARVGFFNLLESYLVSHKTKIHLSVKGYGVEKSHGDEEVFINGSAFHRITTNLFKNISESNTQEIDICLSGSEEGLSLITRNKIYTGEGEENRLELITEKRGRSNTPGLGLESIDSLCRLEGGGYHFYIEDGVWVGELYLPWEFVEKKSKSA